MRVKSFFRSILLLPLLSGLFLRDVARGAPEGSVLGDLDFALTLVRSDPAVVQVPSTHDTAGPDKRSYESKASMKLEKPADGSIEGQGRVPKAMTLDRSVLETDTVTVQAETKVRDLLRSRSIVPDGDALSAVYLLNPEVRDVGALKAGTRLILPTVPRGKITPGAEVQLRLMPETKRELDLSAQAIDSLVGQFDTLPAEQAGTPDEHKRLAEALDTIRGYLGDLNALAEEREVPLSPEMLSQALDGTRVVREVLDRTSHPNSRWSAEDRQAVTGIAEDMILKARNFDELRGPGKSPTRWRDVRVVVAVVQLPGQKPVSDLRVFYAPEALIKTPSAARPFPGFSPQVAKRLIEADYVFWATSPGSSQPVTEQFPQQVRRNPKDEIEIKIAILPSKKENR